MVIFDLDGLLVNTEILHWRAYKKACQEVGYVMDWDFDSYFQTASTSETGVRDRLAKEHPLLFQTTSWDTLYEKKQKALLDSLSSEPIPLMPGVVEMLERARTNGLLMACVTHSRSRFVDAMKSQHPILSYIKAWYPRESYSRAKPAPDGYLTAVEAEHLLPEEVVGFEDSFRGVMAQLQAGIHSVLISRDLETQKAVSAYPRVAIFPSLLDVLISPAFQPLFHE